jgi:hypothetical protein
VRLADERPAGGVKCVVFRHEFNASVRI